MGHSQPARGTLELFGLDRAHERGGDPLQVSGLPFSCHLTKSLNSARDALLNGGCLGSELQITVA
jgi:hypothetical protein